MAAGRSAAGLSAAFRTQAVVVGAGVLGLAAARALATRGVETLVLERRAAIGEETSSRNSEVIHAGIYFGPTMEKTRLCVAGKASLYRYLAERRLGHAQCGKLVVACEPSELATLDAIEARARANGVLDLERWSAERVRAREPQVRCVGAIFSPSTGIVDSGALLVSYLGDVEHARGTLALRTSVERIDRASDGSFLVHCGPDGVTIGCEMVVNAAGLGAQSLARAMPFFPASRVPRELWVKGSYFFLAGGAKPFSTLVYPVPNTLSLGVHVTIDLAGAVRFGPDQQPIPARNDGAPDYRVQLERADGFYAAIRLYYPALPDGAIAPGYAGVRPKLANATDFAVLGPREHGFDGLVHMFGMDSPGLTASLAVGELVAAKLGCT